MQIPRSANDLKILVENRVAEDLHLDYKQSDLFEKPPNGVKTDLAKDVSAFANSDGGIVVYGIVEKGHIPIAIDPGIDHAKWTRERIESIINSNVDPRIDGIEIQQIELSSERSAYVIAVPKTFRGPHHDRISHRYYKRLNFSSVPMEHYEIEDVRNRHDILLPLISVDIDVRQGVLMDLVIKNIGDIPAENLRLTVSNNLPHLTSGDATHNILTRPNILTRGSSFFPPGKEYRLPIGSALKLVTEESAPSFDVEASYFNRRAAGRVTDQFHIDMGDYLNSAVIESDVTQQGRKLSEQLRKLTEEVANVNRMLESLSSIAGATGLDISVRALRNLRRLGGFDNDIVLEPIPASQVSWQGFAEVLRVDRQLAMRIKYFADQPTGELEDIEGMTPELAKRAREAFIFDA